jgi:hypothetical protein
MPQTTQSGRASTLRDLLADPPLVHGPEGGNDLITHGLLPVVLEFIEREVQPGHRTLETGCGLSTILFALRGAEHTCIVPNPPEVERVRSWCDEHGVDHAALTFHVEPSERVLPGADLGSLDLVLIDGSHSFPQVFLDWFYTQEALKVGGTLLVDDVHVWTGRVLRGFLEAEPEWELVKRFQGRTVAFRKTAPTDPDKVWFEQPYVERRTRAKVLGRARMAADLIREGDVGELGKRLRALRSGGS